MNDNVVEQAALVPFWDTQITITNVDGHLQFEGRMNPLKTPETTDKAAVVFTEFLANQLGELVKMSALSYAAQHAPANEAMALIGSDFKPAEADAQS